MCILFSGYIENLNVKHHPDSESIRNKIGERCSAFGGCVAIVTTSYLYLTILAKIFYSQHCKIQLVELSILKCRAESLFLHMVLLSASRLFQVSLSMFSIIYCSFFTVVFWMLLFMFCFSFWFRFSVAFFPTRTLSVGFSYDLLHIRAMRKFIFNKFRGICWCFCDFVWALSDLLILLTFEQY